MSDREIMNAKNPKNLPKKLPDARLHQIVSFIKSSIRMVGYFFIPFNLAYAAFILILSEIIGIIEELV